MKNLILIFLIVCFANSQAEESDSKTFDCSISIQKKSKVIEVKSSDIKWQDHYDSLEEFEAALVAFPEVNKFTDFNLEEWEFSNIYQRASLIVEASVSSKEPLNLEINERLKAIFLDFETQASLTISAVYKNNYDKTLKSGDSIDVNLNSRLLFDTTLGVPIFKLQDDYEKYRKIRQSSYVSGNSVEIGGFSEGVESFYASAYEANISIPIVISSVGVYWDHLCGEDYLVNNKRYLFFIYFHEYRDKNDKQLELLPGFSVFNRKHRNLVEVLIESDKTKGVRID